MDNYSLMMSKIRSTEALGTFSRLYGHGDSTLSGQIARYSQLVKLHEDVYHSQSPMKIVSAPGRVEIAGNHTDHNNGKVLAAAVNLDAVAAVTPRDDMLARVQSIGYAPLEISLDDLLAREEEIGTSAALIRGVAAAMRERKLKIGGFDAVVASDVMGGSGLSSSAAYEVLMCAVLDALYNGFTVDAVERARIAQYAENVYFGKPSGLMDQMASSVGGLVAIDFKADPAIEPLSFSFAEAGYSIVVVNTGASHDNLTNEYALIRSDMEKVAAHFGERTLRRVHPEQVLEDIVALRKECGERAILRALHYFKENARVKNDVCAIKKNDVEKLLGGIVESGESSWMLLQNVFAQCTGGEQPLALALALAKDMLSGKGAWRVHGGGFAGTTLNIVPTGDVPYFVRHMERAFGNSCCLVLDVRPVGAAVVCE